MLLEAKLPVRVRVGSHSTWSLTAWTESVSRHLAVVRSSGLPDAARTIKKNDEVAIEIDLPKAHPFPPRCLHCDGRVKFVSQTLDDGVRLGMIVDRMQFRAAKSGASRGGALYSVREHCPERRRDD